MNEFGLIADNGTIRFARMLSRPAQELWEYLTRPRWLSIWLAQGTIELRVGGFIELSFEATEGSERAESGLPISGVVTRCVQPESLALTWTDARTISHVAFELETRESGVLLLLTHAGVPMELAIRSAASWHVHLDMLEALLENTKSVSYAERFSKVIAHYEHHREARVLRTRSAMHSQTV